MTTRLHPIVRGLALSFAVLAMLGCSKEPPTDTPTSADASQDKAAATDTVATAQPQPSPVAIVPAGRSPLPQEGETITKPLPALPANGAEHYDPGPPPDLKPGESVPWNEAHRYAGHTVTVEGTIVDTHRAATICFLNFDKDWQGKFYMVVFKDDFDAWPPSPDVHFLNRKVRVTGLVELHRGRPQLKIKEKSQVQFVD